MNLLVVFQQKEAIGGSIDIEIRFKIFNLIYVGLCLTQLFGWRS